MTTQRGLPLLHPPGAPALFPGAAGTLLSWGPSLALRGPAERDRKSGWESALPARPREGQFHFSQFVSLIMQIGKVG